jgi:FkbM family methyltransferase
MGRAPEVLRCLRQTPQWRQLAGAYLGVSRLPYPAIVKLRDGNCFRLTEMYDLETLWQIYFHRVYQVRPSDLVVIDAGANIGLFSCWAARQAADARIYAIEPAPGTFQRLNGHVSGNGMTNRVKCFQAALGGRQGRLMMSTGGAASQMFRILAPGRKVPESAVEVEVMTLGDFVAAVLADSGAKRVDLLKMDIEGSEYETLLPDRLEAIDRIQVEYHEPREPIGHSRAGLMEHLSNCGFKRVRQSGDPDYGLLWYER